jgi:hypothetical protein
MSEFILNLPSFLFFIAFVLLMYAWIYVCHHERKLFKFEHIFFPYILQDYKKISKEKNGKEGMLPTLFWAVVLLLVITFALTSARIQVR